MKNFILLLLFLTGFFATKGQIVNSFCTAPDSVVSFYEDDAYRLAVRKLFRNNLPDKDSIYIPTIHSDTVLKALLAVYNATTLPARDTVVSMFDIHSKPDYSVNSFSIRADSTLSWMQQLKVGNIPTGNPLIDSLMAKYHLSMTNYTHFQFLNVPWDLVAFKSASNYNIRPLKALFDTISGVYATFQADVPNSWDNNINDSLYADHVELLYTYAFGDCPAGCTGYRFWKFNIYFDCSVEYMGSYGTPLPTEIQNHEIQHVTLYPNPFKDAIFISGTSKPFNFSVSNTLGQVLLNGQSINNSIPYLDQLPFGVYILTIKTDNNIGTFKMCKE